MFLLVKFKKCTLRIIKLPYIKYLSARVKANYSLGRRVQGFVAVVIHLWRGVTLLYWNWCYVATCLWVTGRIKNGINPVYHYSFGVGWVMPCVACINFCWDAWQHVLLTLILHKSLYFNIWNHKAKWFKIGINLF